MNANFTGSASRRTPWLLLRCSLFFRDPERFAEAHELLALGRRQAGAPLRAISLRLLDPIAQCRRDEIELARHRRDALALVED